jgi:hypothetical protein
LRYARVDWNCIVSLKYLMNRVATAGLKGTLIRHA